jgi:hypothetical protein
LEVSSQPESDIKMMHRKIIIILIVEIFAIRIPCNFLL